MPNWCQNILTVTCGETVANRNSLRNFVKQNTNDDDVFSLNQKVPQPQCDNHRLFYWGCKWDVHPDCLFISAHSESKYEINFDTANGPCEQWFATIIRMYPSLDFKLVYSEFNGDFSGIVEASNGVRTRDDFGDYLTFCPMHYVICEECNEEFDFDFDVDKRKECRSLVCHMAEYDHCTECSKSKFQRFWGNYRIFKFMNDNINHRLFRYPDGIRLPNIMTHFNAMKNC